MTPSDNTTQKESMQQTLQERINEGWMKAAQTLPVDKQTKMDFWEAGYRSMLEEISSLQSEHDQLKEENEILKNEERPFFIEWINSVKEQLTTANKVIDQCEEALKKVGNTKYYADEYSRQAAQECLSAIQSLKLKGK